LSGYPTKILRTAALHIFLKKTISALGTICYLRSLPSPYQQAAFQNTDTDMEIKLDFSLHSQSFTARFVFEIKITCGSLHWDFGDKHKR
jgi:hypothetical protein